MFEIVEGGRGREKRGGKGRRKKKDGGAGRRGEGERGNWQTGGLDKIYERGGTGRQVGWTRFMYRGQALKGKK